MSSLRLFLAVEPSAAVRSSLADCVTGLRRRLPGVKWVPGENFHITLRFLGNIPDERLPELCAVCGDALRRQTAFSCAAAGLGAFPRSGRVTVIWADVIRGRRGLAGLVEALESRLRDAGFVAEPAAFRAHITLGRVRRRATVHRRDLSPHIETWQGREFGQWRVDRVTLFQSTLTADGPVYSALKHWELPASASATAKG